MRSVIIAALLTASLNCNAMTVGDFSPTQALRIVQQHSASWLRQPDQHLRLARAR